MRTLKKTLCLVLAVIFVLGLCTIGAAAAIEDTGYSDAAAVTYTKAVTILTKLNVIEGYTDGSFQPAKSVTRAEAAAMIARMMLGGKEEAAKLPDAEDISFTDVPTTSWAAKYISFCVSKGIIKGMGDGTFRPQDNVTGTQLAAMLLRALGYGQMGEYEGAGWNTNAVSDALYYGVFKGTKDTNFDDAATREETALYVFNTMFLDRVAYQQGYNAYKVQWDWSNAYPNFAWSAFQLVGNFAQIMENQATGAVYTVIDDYDRGYVNLDVETGLDLIAHEVIAYYRFESVEDHPNHLYVSDCYYLDDVTTVLDKGSSYDDFYRNAVALNSANKNSAFADFQLWTNYVYTGGNAGPVMSYDDFFQHGTFVFYYDLVELKGQEAYWDMASLISGTWLFDYDGLPLANLRTSYQIGQVKDIDTKHDEIDVNVYNASADTYTLKTFDLALAYEGIAKGDYVVVQPVGDLTYLYATTTKTVDITERSGSYFNRYAYWQDSSGYGIEIEDADDYEDVTVGDTVKFYISKDYGFYAYYFGLEIIDKADLYGTVFVNYAKAVTNAGEWGDQTVYKVQCITEDGKEVIYKVKAGQFAEITGSDGKVEKGVYYVYVNSKGFATLDPVPDSKFFKENGRNAYLRSGEEVYYVQDDTNVIYFTGEGDDLEITVSKRLSNREDGQGYDVYAVYRGKSSPYKLETVWCPGQVPLGNYADSYLFVFEDHSNSNWLSPTGYGDGKEIPYYDVWIDGAAISVQLKPDGSSFFYKDYVRFGFYSYEIDEDGVYYLKPVEATQTDVLVKGDVKNGRLYTADADGVRISAEIVDVAADTTVGTKKDTNITSVERLEELLNDGYEITITYIYNTVGSNRVPAGTIYVTSVLDPVNAK